MQAFPQSSIDRTLLCGMCLHAQRSSADLTHTAQVDPIHVRQDMSLHFVADLMIHLCCMKDTAYAWMGKWLLQHVLLSTLLTRSPACRGDCSFPRSCNAYSDSEIIDTIEKQNSETLGHSETRFTLGGCFSHRDDLQSGEASLLRQHPPQSQA